MVVIVEPGPKTPVRGILSRPIVSPTKLEMTDAQIKRAILSGGCVFKANKDGSKSQITFSNGKLHVADKAAVEQPVEEVKVTEPEQIKEEPAAPMHKTKAQRREEERLAREAAQREAREKAEAERLAKEEAEAKAKAEEEARKAEEERLAAEAAAEEEVAEETEEVTEESDATEDEELAEIERMIAEEEAAKEAAEVVEE